MNMDDSRVPTISGNLLIWGLACLRTWPTVGITQIDLLNVQGGAPKIAKLVNITPKTMVYGTQITIVFMGFINQQTSLGGPTL